MKTGIQILIQATQVQPRNGRSKSVEVRRKGLEAGIAGFLVFGYSRTRFETALEMLKGNGQPHGILHNAVFPKKQDFGVVKAVLERGFHGWCGI